MKNKQKSQRYHNNAYRLERKENQRKYNILEEKGIWKTS